MRRESGERPKVWAPPPLFFIVPLVVGMALHYLFPTSFLPEGWLQFAIGVPMAFIGSILASASARTLARAKTDLAFTKPTSVVVMHGPFRFSRNPLYLGAIFFYLGIAVALNALWPLVLLPVVLLLFLFGAILPEERFLERQFGEDYLQYKAKVRRWV